jgi:porin
VNDSNGGAAARKGTNTFMSLAISNTYSNLCRRHARLAALAVPVVVYLLTGIQPAAADVAIPSPAPAVNTPAPASLPDYSSELTGNWFGWRPWLQNRGIKFSGSIVTDGSYDLSGGLATRRSAYRTLLTVNASLDTDTLFNLPGGTIYASYEGLWGQNGNTTQVGSLQGFDSIDAPPFSALYQLYYDQMFGKMLELRVGRQDAGDFFSDPPDAQPFVNPSPTAFPTIIGSALYPDSAPGIVTVLSPNGPLTFKFGAYYFDRFHPTALDEALNTLEPTGQPVGTFLIAEGDYNWQLSSNLPGVLALGGTWRTGQLATLSGSVQSGGGSGYGYIDQTLWSHANNQSIAAFEILSGGDQQVANNGMDFSSLGGVLGNGLIPSRPNDQIGLGYDWAHISSQAGLPKPYELAIEGFYSFNFKHGISLQPDLQYFINDGGGQYPDALVVDIRLSVAF